MIWYERECTDCGTVYTTWNEEAVCPDCGSVNFVDALDDCCCDKCRSDVGVEMRTYNVVVSVGVELEFQARGEDENVAAREVLNMVSSRDLFEIMQEADYVATSEPEIVNSWEIEDE